MPRPLSFSEDVIALGEGRYAHFRRHRRFAQVQVVFTAPPGIDPNPGRELTDRFKEQGWQWRESEPDQPWTYQLDPSTPADPTARGDCHDALHEQFVDIIQEFRHRRGLPPTLEGWRPFGDDAPSLISASPLPADDPSRDQHPPSVENPPPKSAEEARAGAAAMLDAFASVGAQHLDLTLTDVGGGKVAFRRSLSLDELCPELASLLADAAAHRHNVIVRPRSDGPTLIQLDDLDELDVARLRPVCFLALRTSPGNYQVWVAVSDADADFARRLRRSLGADPTASGAARLSGSLNFKARHAPDYPLVETIHASPGRVVSRAELEAFGIETPAERQPAPRVCPSRSAARGWPSYRRCVEQAPPAKSGDRPDISRADFTFCLLAIDWGWSVEETAARLMQESSKAQQEGERYAERTARNAAAAIEQRQHRGR